MVVEVAKRVALALGAAMLTLVALEVGLRGFVKPSPMSAGRLLGSELPPMRLVPREPPVRRVRRDGPAGRIRYDDLNGLVREDAVLGYAPREEAVSTNGWWQSNNIGARARHATAAARVPGKTRVLIFGDSFAAGSRVPQESAWPAVLEAANPTLEVVSLGVDGYSAAQSLLRYRTLADRLEHDVVLLTQSPRADFWREVNTLRALAGWRSYTVMPRFVLDDGRLQLVPSPYEPPLAIYADNRDVPSPRLRDHLQRYDRFYVPWMYDASLGLASSSVLAKLVLARWHAALLRRRHEEVLEPGSEAVAVSGRIARAMHDEARAHGARFLQILLPSELDLGRLRRRPAYREQWHALAAAVSGVGVDCVDLAETLLAPPAEVVDRGFDGTHHGPRANRLIAEAVARALAEPRSAKRDRCVNPRRARHLPLRTDNLGKRTRFGLHGTRETYQGLPLSRRRGVVLSRERRGTEGRRRHRRPADRAQRADRRRRRRTVPALRRCWSGGRFSGHGATGTADERERPRPRARQGQEAQGQPAEADAQDGQGQEAAGKVG